MAVRQFIKVLALAGGVAASAGVCFGAAVRPLFVSGQAAPPGLSFASFGRAAVNARGTLCFMAGWDSLQHRPEGLFLRQAGQVLPIARAGDPIPGSPGDHFSFPPGNPDELTSFSLNSQDQVAFIARQGLYLYSQGTITPVAQIGGEFPGYPDELWDEIDAVSLNSSGTIAFVGVLRSVQLGSRQGGVFLAAGSNVQIAFYAGDQVPNLDGILDGFTAVSLNDAGEMATLALEGDAELGCILLTSKTGTAPVVVEGQPAPRGEVWTELDSVALNNSGAIAFAGRAMSGSADHAGIYLAAGGTVSPMALPGQTIAGSEGGTLSDNLGRPVIDDAGHVTLVAALAGTPPRRALVTSDGSSIAALASVGQPSPGKLTGSISRFSGLNLGSSGADGIVCGTSLAGGKEPDAIVQYPFKGDPQVLISTASPLPPGATLSLLDGATPSRMVQARVNRQGDVVFVADVGGYGRALFRKGVNGLELLTPLGQGGSTLNVGSVTSFDLNDAGQLALLGVRDEADQDVAIFALSLETPRNVQVIAATGDTLPTVPARSALALGPPRIDSMGDLVFSAQGVGADSSAAQSFLLRAHSGHLETLAAEGQPIGGVGTLSGAAVVGSGPTSTLFQALQLSRDGEVLFLSSYLDGPTSAVVLAGLFILRGGAVWAVALPGQKAPFSDGGSYTGFATPRLSDGGESTFTATVRGPGRKSRAGLFRTNSQQSSKLAANGDLAPGLDATKFQSISDPVVNAAGDVAFVGTLTPPPTQGSSSAMFISMGGVIRLALKDGDPVNGMEGAAIHLDDNLPAAPLWLGDDGSLLVAASLHGGPAPDGLFLVQP